MAYKRYPEDEDSQVIGIRFPMNGKGAGSNGGFFNTSRTTEDQAVTNYINLLLTKPGERYHQPNFGVFIQGFLFEQNTESVRTEIEFRIRQQASYWLPHIVNHDIQVMPRSQPGIVDSDPENAIQIRITFSVTEKGANKTVTIFETNGRVTTNVE